MTPPPSAPTIGVLQPMESWMTDNPEDNPAVDLYGRALALEAIVTRLVASHAQMHPNGVAARMLADIEGVVDTVKDGLPEGAEALSTVIESHLRHYLSRAKELRDDVAG